MEYAYNDCCNKTEKKTTRLVQKVKRTRGITETPE